MRFIVVNVLFLSGIGPENRAETLPNAAPRAQRLFEARRMRGAHELALLPLPNAGLASLLPDYNLLLFRAKRGEAMTQGRKKRARRIRDEREAADGNPAQAIHAPRSTGVRRRCARKNARLTP
jgi:hypothetical protein